MINALLEEKIKSSLNKHKIILHPNIKLAINYSPQYSQTNQFIKIMDINQNDYLIRINGKLWPPFTRKNESNHLKQIEKFKMNSNVIVNDEKNGFQICYFDNRNHNKTFSTQFLKKIAITIKKYHSQLNFENEYSVIETMTRSFSSLSPVNKKTLSAYYNIILNLYCALAHDKDNFVASHNDLLPTSVFLKQDKVILVDWEYSGKAHRSYDLAFFSLKSGLTTSQENILIDTYDSYDYFNLKKSVLLMKPIIAFLLLMWNALSKSQHPISPDSLQSINHHLKDVTVNQSLRTLLSPNPFPFFKGARKKNNKIIRNSPMLANQTL